jgi:hypothetical protein
MRAFRRNIEAIESTILAAISHAKKHGRKVKEIQLHPSRWMLFEMSMRQRYPEKFPDEKFDAVQFKHYQIKKGSLMMADIMNIVYETPTANA